MGHAHAIVRREHGGYLAASSPIRGPRSAERRLARSAAASGTGRPPGTIEGWTPETVDEVRDALAAARLPRRRGPRDGASSSRCRLQRPLLLEGEAGVGKTEVAKVLARWTGGELVRLQCYEGIDASQAVYEWDYSRQLLHLRAVEASGGPVVEDELYSERFLVRRPLLRAIDHEGSQPPVLLVDEVDRADDEFEAFLLEILSDYSITVPELGTFRAAMPPIVILTSNRTRDVHDALKRRCLYHWIDHPDFERELAIVRAAGARGGRGARAPGRRRGRGAARPRAVQAARRRRDDRLGAGARRARRRRSSTSATVESSLGTVLKYREDQERVREHGVGAIVRRARGVTASRDGRDGPIDRVRRRTGSRSRSPRRACAAAGLDVPVGATITFAEALAAVGLESPRSRLLGRAGDARARPEDIADYDRAFDVVLARRDAASRCRGGSASRRRSRSRSTTPTRPSPTRRRRRGDDGPVLPVR